MIVFLEFMMFIMNSVPQTNGVILARWISLSFFWMSLFSIAFAYVLYEIT